MNINKIQLNQNQLTTLNLLLKQKSVPQIAKEINKPWSFVNNHFEKLTNKGLLVKRDGLWQRTDVEFEVIPDVKLYGKEWRRQNDRRWEDRIKRIQKIKERIHNG